MGEQRTLTRDVAVLSAGFKSAAVSRWADVNVVLSNGVYSSHRLVLASARRGFLYHRLPAYILASQHDNFCDVALQMHTGCSSDILAFIYQRIVCIFRLQCAPIGVILVPRRKITDVSCRLCLVRMYYSSDTRSHCRGMLGANVRFSNHPCAYRAEQTNNLPGSRDHPSITYPWQMHSQRGGAQL